MARLVGDTNHSTGGTSPRVPGLERVGVAAETEVVLTGVLEQVRLFFSGY
jgi:hypothetical protein